jgi:hypothetical protein
LSILNLQDTAFSHETDISETVLLNICKGKNKPSFDVIEKIITRYPAINAEWLITGKGAMLNKRLQKPALSYDNISLPIFSMGQIGDILTTEWKVSDRQLGSVMIPSFQNGSVPISVSGSLRRLVS